MTMKTNVSKSVLVILAMAALWIGAARPAMADQNQMEPEPVQLYPDEPEEADFGMADGRSIGEGHIGLMLAGGYPQSRMEIRFCPWNYIDMGIDTDVGYSPDVYLSYFVLVQFLEAPGGWFNLGTKAALGMRWQNQEPADAFFFSPSASAIAGIGWSRIFFTLEATLIYNIGAHANANDDLQIIPLAGVEFRLMENLTIFAKGGYEFVPYGDRAQRLSATAGAAFRF